MATKNPFRREVKKDEGKTYHRSKLGQRNVLIEGIALGLDVYKGIDNDYAMIDGRFKMVHKTRQKINGSLVLWEVR